MTAQGFQVHVIPQNKPNNIISIVGFLSRKEIQLQNVNFIEAWSKLHVLRNKELEGKWCYSPCTNCKLAGKSR